MKLTSHLLVRFEASQTPDLVDRTSREGKRGGFCMSGTGCGYLGRICSYVTNRVRVSS